MRLLQKTKDGGPESTVSAYFLIEIKSLFSIAILRFNKGSRENYHTHAFNALTWFLFGSMVEKTIELDKICTTVTTLEDSYRFSIVPKYTPRLRNHKVIAEKTSWALTIRGPWEPKWTEYNQKKNETTTLTHGRKIV